MNQILMTSEMHSPRRPSGRNLLFIPVVALLLGLGACQETPLEPTLGSGDELSAIIDGTSVTFDYEKDLSSYNAVTDDGRIIGATNTEPIKSISVNFRGVDLDNDEFPKTLAQAAATITLITNNESGDELVYRTPADISMSNTTITITATNGSIVDGTFSGTLVEDDDPSDIISVTGGSFSAELPRE